MTDRDEGPSRRKVLECMTWAGTGVLWTISGGVPHSLGLIDEAEAADAKGPHLPADQRQPYGLRQAGQPERQGHAGRGDRAHQGDAGEAGLHDPHRRHHASVEGSPNSTTPRSIISQARLDVHYVPGEHDIDRSTSIKLYKDRYGRGTKGAGYYQLRRQRRAFHGSGQCRQSQRRRHGQPRRRAARMDRGRPERPFRLARRSWCSRISRCGRSIRNGAGAPRTARARSAT